MLSLPGYEKIENIRENGNSEVYKAYSLKLKKDVIIKILNDDDLPKDGSLQFTRELHITKDLHINGIRKAIELDTISGKQILVLEYFEGQSFKQFFYKLRRTANTKIFLEIFIKATIEVAKVLQSIHNSNIIHRDINPNNILIHEGSMEVKIIDFGISSKYNLKIKNINNSEKLEGTIAYIPPEQTGRMNRRVDYRSDLYSLGITLYEILTGELPFQSNEPLELIHSHIAKTPPTPSRLNLELDDSLIPRVLVKIVMKLISKNPEDRYGSAFGLKNDLELCLQALNDNLESLYNLTFKPGANDFLKIFALPEKLYGREEEISSILKYINTLILQSKTKTGTDLILISGASGSGKSSIIKEIQKLVTSNKPLFISGKFNERHGNIPYHGWTEAFREFVNTLLLENTETLNSWKSAILNAIGENGKVLIDFVPEMELIIGEQNEVNVKSGIEELNRFQYIFQNFIKAISTDKHPIIITLDDMQWIDNASLELMKILLKDNSINNLLLIGIYREDNLTNSHPLIHTINILKDYGLNILKLRAQNLSESNIAELLSDTLHCDTKLLSELSSVIFQKTGGNAFFMNQFIHSLHDEGKIKLNSDKMEWEWDIREIKNLSATENVADLLYRKIKKLEKNVYEILEIASCIGNIFQVLVLSNISEKKQETVFDFLSDAASEGIIIPLNENMEYLKAEKSFPVVFKFAHDRLQQIFYSNISSKEKNLIHYKIGNFLLKSICGDEINFSIIGAPRKLEDSIFEITNHFELASEIILSPESKLILAKLNFLSGKQAKSSIAYGTALNYFEKGISRLEKDSWKNNYELSFNLYLYAVECANLTHNFELSSKYLNTLFENTNDILEQVKIYKLKIQYLIFQSKPIEAIHCGLEIISKLGEDIPSNPGQIRIVFGLLNLKRILFRKKISSFIDLPIIKDKHKLEIMNILNIIGASAYIAAPNIMPFVIFKIVELSVKYGNAPVSAFGYVSYGLLLSGILESYNEGMEFGEVGLKLLNKFNAQEFFSSTVFVYNGFIRHFRINPWKTAEDLKLAFTKGMEVGEMEYAGYSLLTACHCLIFGQRKIQASKIEFEDSLKTLHKYGQVKALNYLRIYYSCLLSMGGFTDDPAHIRNSEIDEDNLSVNFTEDDKTAMATFYYIRLLVGYHFRDYESAFESINKANIYEEAMKGTHLYSQSLFYKSLLYIALCRQNKISKKEMKRLVFPSLKKIKKMSDFGPENYYHKYFLIQAELNSILKKNIKAFEYYDIAIDKARESDYPGDAGLSCELAGEFYLSINKTRQAIYYFYEARQSYERWGAEGKIKQLEKLHPQYFKKSIKPSSVVSTSGATYQGTKFTTSQSLDSASFIKASNSLSKEIRLDKLLGSMIRFLLENAGAEKGILVLKKGDNWFIEAEGNMKNSDVKVMSSTPFPENNSEEIPVSIINYVIRTKEIVLIDDASKTNQFEKDSYIVKSQPRSILCIPMVYQNKTTGILYLENNLLSNAFQEERVETLKLMSSQMAISIENAMLYSNLQESLEEQVKLAKAYSRFVPSEMLNYLNKKSIVDVQLGDHVEKEMTVLFSDIRGFTSMSEKMTPKENFHFINSYLRRVGPHVRNQGGFIDKFIGDAIMALFPRSPDDGLKAAIEMQKEIYLYNEHRRKIGYEPISVGTGLHTGILMFGTIGENERLEGTVISDTVNQASRIEGLTKVYGAKIIVSENTLLKIEDPEKFLHRRLGLVKVKGKEKVIAVYEILEGMEEELKYLYYETRLSFELGIDFYQQKKFQDALNLFNIVLNKIPDDKAAILYIQRATKLLSDGVPENWEPVEVIHEK